MFKNLLDKGKCSLGFHEGEWRYEQPDACTQLRVCQRCQAESRRTEHQWGEWAYPAADACDLVRMCGRCGERESRIEHHWGEVVYARPGSCEQVTICERCGEEKAAPIQHQWDHWLYQSADDCTQVQMCGRCGEYGRQTRINHEWGEWQDSPFYNAPVRVCRHCAEMVFDLAQEAGGEATPSMQAYDQTVEKLLAASSIERVYQLVHENRATLLSPVGERYFRFALEQYPPEPGVQEGLQNLQGLLQQCQLYGIEAVFNVLSGGVQAEPAPAGQPGPAPGAQSGVPGQLDRRLAGRWRHTESMMSGDFSMATDTHMLLDQDGRFAWYSKSAGSFGTSQTEPEYGQWQVVDGQLCLFFDGGSRFCQEFVLEGDTLFLPNEGTYRLWHQY